MVWQNLWQGCRDFMQGWSLFQMGKITMENQQLKKEVEQKDAQLQEACRPALSWNDVMEWLQQGGGQ